MMVTISGERQYTYWLWSDETSTWGSALNTIWRDAILIGNDTLMATPEPTISNSIDKRSTAQFVLLDIGSVDTYTSGQEVLIYGDNGIFMFGGYIDSCEDSIAGNMTRIKHNISCVDYHYLADKKIVSKTWQDTTIEIIVNYIVDQYLEVEGVTVGAIDPAGDIKQYVAGYITASTVIQDMADRCGFIWWIDEYKKLYFVERDAYPAEWDLIEESNFVVTDAIEGLSVTHGNPEYRNKQYIIGSQNKTSLQTEISVGDGYKTTFTVGYKIAEEPEVWTSLNGADYIQKTVGVKENDTGKDWYWGAEDTTIIQDSDGVKLTSVDKIKIIFTGLYSIVAVSSDFVEIAARVLLEGSESSGIVEHAITDNTINDNDAALEKANALLDIYAVAGKKVKYTTIRSGLSAGTIQQITVSKLHINDTFLISNVDVRYTNGIDYYDINAFTGPIEDSWEDIFLNITKTQKDAMNVDTTGVSDVLIVLFVFTNAWESTDDPNIWYEFLADGAVHPGTNYSPMFEVDDRIKYISLRNDGVERFRMYRTLQVSTINSISTTFIIPSNSAKFEVDQAVLVGGDSATLDFGTGVDVETHAFAYTKNNLESLQMQFTSTKWA